MASQTDPVLVDPLSSPKDSFSTEFLNEADFISITPNEEICSNDFDFFQSHRKMLSADELFSQGKLLPSSQIQSATQRLPKINLNKNVDEDDRKADHQTTSCKRLEKPMIRFLDDEASPRPPKCAVLWKGLLKQRKQRAAASSSSNILPFSSTSMDDEHVAPLESRIRRVKKGRERAKSSSDSVRVRPMVNCNQGTAVRCHHCFISRN